MPEISRFYGIVIRMYYQDHQPPHVHACYNEYDAAFNMYGIAIKGSLPNRAEMLVSMWVQQNWKELLQMWETKEFYKLPPLD